MRSVTATLSFGPNPQRHFRLPPEGTPSLVYIFDGGVQLGARAWSASGEPFAPDTSQSDVRLDFWAGDEWTSAVIPGARFTIWYGGDVGQGTVDEEIAAPDTRP